VTSIIGHHPFHALGTEVRHLGAIAKEGESALTLPILIGFWLVAVVFLVALVVALAFAIAYLATGSTGTSYT
jgi:F0F1-type ATP synthase membrane subunit c/vacuolar-type H+-ATPase subunit K